MNCRRTAEFFLCSASRRTQRPPFLRQARRTRRKNAKEERAVLRECAKNKAVRRTSREPAEERIVRRTRQNADGRRFVRRTHRSASGSSQSRAKNAAVPPTNAAVLPAVLRRSPGEERCSSADERRCSLGTVTSWFPSVLGRTGNSASCSSR